MPSDVFKLGEWEVRPSEGCMRSAGKELRLEPRLMRVLVVLARAGGRIVSKDELVTAVWDDMAISDDAITSAIYRLRRALAGEDRPYIETASKRGYRVVVPVQFGQNDKEANGDAIAHALESLAEPSLAVLHAARLTFERALEADPADNRALAGLAEAMVLTAWAGAVAGRETMTLAHTTALNALGQRPTVGAAHRAAALTFAFRRNDLAAANEQLAKARSFSIDRSTLRAESLVRAMEGRFDDAVAALDEAIAINPMSLGFGYLKTQVQILARNFQGAVTESNRLISLYPQFSPPWTARGWALHFLGESDAAAAAFRDSLASAGASEAIVKQFDEALERQGMPGAFGLVYSLLTAPSLNHPPRATDLAFLAAGAGNVTAAFGHLRKAIAEYDPIMAFARYLPHLDPLRDFPEFSVLGFAS